MCKNEVASIDQIIENLFYIHPLVSISLTRPIRTYTNLNPGSLYVMGLLSRTEIMSMSEIGAKLRMPKPHVTTKVDQLVKEEMVERLYDPNDRRVINIRLTEKGQKCFKEIKQEIGEELRQRFARLDLQTLKEMLDSTQQVRTVLTEIMKDFPLEKK